MHFYFGFCLVAAAYQSAMDTRRQDFDALQQFVRNGDQAAFAAVVRRHLDLVYATALRKVEQPAGAQEISQNVFAILARKAWRFARDDSLPAWLYRTTLLEARQWLRGELRRRRREQIAAELGTTMKTSDEQASQALLPLLDEALLSLREKERTALLLRYYEGRSLRDLGNSLGISEDAAQKRVAGALHQLAQFFKRRGYLRATGPMLASTLAHTAIKAPSLVHATLCQQALQATPPILGVLGGLAAHVLTLSKLQKVALGILLLTLPAFWQWNAYRNARLAEQATRARIETERQAKLQEERQAVALAAQVRRDEAARRYYERRTEQIERSPVIGDYIVELRGIFALPDTRAAVLTIKDRSSQHPLSRGIAPRLVWEGQALTNLPAKEGNASLELIQIDGDAWDVLLREDRQERKYELPRPSSRERVNLRVIQIEFKDFLDVYGTLMGRTLLIHPRIAREAISFSAFAADKAEAVELCRKFLEGKSIRTILDGEKFARLVPLDFADPAEPYRKAPERDRLEKGQTETGAINLENADIKDSVQIFAAISQRKCVDQEHLPRAETVTFRSQTPLTRTEAIHAFEVLFRWRGLKIVYLGKDHFRVVEEKAKG